MQHQPVTQMPTNRLREVELNPWAAAEYLNKLGIKGIKYFDGTSRAGKEGTRNLVVFDDKIIKTLTRNGEDI